MQGNENKSFHYFKSLQYFSSYVESRFSNTWSYCKGMDLNMAPAELLLSSSCRWVGEKYRKREGIREGNKHYSFNYFWFWLFLLPWHKSLQKWMQPLSHCKDFSSLSSLRVKSPWYYLLILQWNETALAILMGGSNVGDTTFSKIWLRFLFIRLY